MISGSCSQFCSILHLDIEVQFEIGRLFLSDVRSEISRLLWTSFFVRCSSSNRKSVVDVRFEIGCPSRPNSDPTASYRLASISKLLIIIGLLCKRALQKRLYSAKETYNYKEPTNRSHPIVLACM